MSMLRTVLVADDEASIRHVLSLVLQEQGYEVRAVSNGEEALAELESRDYDAVVSDVRMPRVDGLTLLRKALARQPDLTFVVMSAYGQPDAALEAVGAGAFDYVSKPFKPEEVVLVLRKAEERRRLVNENRRLRRSGAEKGPLDRIVGSSELILQLHKQIRKLAPVSTTVLISGESGTGKELVARALHEISPRAAMPFVPVNCGAIPPGLGTPLVPSAALARAPDRPGPGARRARHLGRAERSGLAQGHGHADDDPHAEAHEAGGERADEGARADEPERRREGPAAALDLQAGQLDPGDLHHSV
jgi:CheY-like chemotaxis protein